MHSQCSLRRQSSAKFQGHASFEVCRASAATVHSPTCCENTSKRDPDFCKPTFEMAPFMSGSRSLKSVGTLEYGRFASMAGAGRLDSLS